MRTTLLLAIFSLLCTAAQAQMYTVTLVVDFAGATLDTPSVAGNFQDDDAILTGVSEWTGGGHDLVRDDVAGVWYRTVSIPSGSYQFKFLPDQTFDNSEGSGLSAACGVDDGFGNFNRIMEISSDTIIGYTFNTCDELTNLVLSAGDVAPASSFTVAPNPGPASGIVVSVDIQANERLSLNVFNMLGQPVVRNFPVVAERVDLANFNLSQGTYLVQLQNEAGAQATRRLIVH